MSAAVVWAPDPVTGAPARESLEWVALCRVQGGQVSAHRREYVASDTADHANGRVTGALARTLDGLLAEGCVTAGLPDRGGHQMLATTVAGEIRYAALLAARLEVGAL